MPIVIGLTGNIASGKTYVADVFRSLGAAVQDSDKVAHAVMETKAYDKIAVRWPEAIEDGKINRQKLGERVFGNINELKELEQILHPLVRGENKQFVEENKNKEFVVLEVPLLFEAGFDKFCDYTIFVNVSAETQMKRALQRPGMTKEKLDKVLSHQMPVAEKIKLAKFVIDNEQGSDILKQVSEILEKVRNA